jgi:signal transduction histidine kinase
VELSACFHPEPSVVFRRVLEVMSDVYGGTMAMINLVEGDRIRYRDIVNPHRLFRGRRAIFLGDSYCQFTMRSVRCTLIQDAAAEPHLQDHPAVRLGFTRYLAAPICTPTGEPIGTVCFLDNRSHELLSQADVEFLSLLAMRVSAELERERIMDERVELERAATARLEAVNTQLVRAAEEKRRFLSTVVHDLRQPLASLRTLLYVVRNEEDANERAECVDLLDERIVALSTLVDELLEYAQIEGGQIPWRLEEVELRDLLFGCVEPFRQEAALHGVQVVLETDHCLGRVQTDPAKLCHVVGNLVSNAVKFAAPTPEEFVERMGENDAASARVVARAWRLEDGGWRLEVEDNGVGMPPDVAAHAFEEFYQGPQAHNAERNARSPRGRGLGLAIVARLCEAMGAEVALQSEPGRGSCFTLTFPQVAQSDQHEVSVR